MPSEINNNENEVQDSMKAPLSTEPNDLSFFDKPRNVNIILYSFYFICALLVLLDFIVHRHIYVDFEKIPAFYAIYGFVACVALVVVAKLMRIVLMRDEHFYDKREDEGVNQASNTADGEQNQ